jgi:formate-dependent nitrite reductase cytochrome c552 subunit
VVKTQGHQISHAAHLARGLDCFQCHRDIAHGTLLGEPTARPMETCASCHTQSQYQMARCTSCHPRTMINNLFLTAKHFRSRL